MLNDGDKGVIVQRDKQTYAVAPHIPCGVVQPDEGRMHLEGREVRFPDPAAANQAGIVCIFQELSLLPDLTVADNICITDPPRRFGMIDHSEPNGSYVFRYVSRGKKPEIKKYEKIGIFAEKDGARDTFRIVDI